MITTAISQKLEGVHLVFVWQVTEKKTVEGGSRNIALGGGDTTSQNLY